MQTLRCQWFGNVRFGMVAPVARLLTALHKHHGADKQTAFSPIPKMVHQSDRTTLSTQTNWIYESPVIVSVAWRFFGEPPFLPTDSLRANKSCGHIFAHVVPGHVFNNLEKAPFDCVDQTVANSQVLETDQKLSPFTNKPTM